MKIRFFFIVSVFILLYGALGANLYRLQVVKSDYYASRIEALSEAQEELSLRRGGIFFTDKFGNDIPVALNKDYPAVYAVPKEIKDTETVSELLAPILAVKKESLQGSIANHELLFRLLAEKVSSETISAVEELRIPGIYTTKKQHRFYPFGELASQAIGFVGLNEKHSAPTGLYGAEKKFEADLKKGKDIHLSIDRNIQAQAEESLKDLIETYKASGGTVIVEDPNTGKILAFANSPAFDPNAYSEFPVGSFINSGIQSVYEPGSVFKPLTMAAGIDSGKITPETTFFDSGSITLNGKKITNWDGKARGKVTMTNVIEQSINTGAVFAVQKIGREPFLEFLKKVGFGEETGIDAPDEAVGSLKNLERKNAEEIDVATAAFGQGTAVTPIQLITAFSAIANGGTLIRPSLNAEVKKIEKKRVMSEETAQKVTAMMESAVDKAAVAALPQHRIAGKTGTAQIPDFKKGGYSDQFVHTYIGFGPVSHPAFVVLIKLDKPNVALAGITVVPAFRELARFILNYYNVPPDKPQSAPLQKQTL